MYLRLNSLGLFRIGKQYLKRRGYGVVYKTMVYVGKVNMEKLFIAYN